MNPLLIRCSIGNDFSILPVMQYMKQVQIVSRSHNSRSDAVYETSKTVSRSHDSYSDAVHETSTNSIKITQFLQ